ncbi:MAG: MBL fold metallo-hydrolase [Alicyclobacillus sp.]|nr:MBL fold metallo-hydrolase [Alicyclobacillus sp.]
MTSRKHGVHLIQGELGPRWLIQVLLVGERALLMDTGVRGSVSSTITPHLYSVGLERDELDWVLISHADVDHFGDNAAIRQAHPHASVVAHELDARWIESRDAILSERYGWYARHGLGYPQDTAQWLRDALGPDQPVDVRVGGGEWIRLSDSWLVQVLHLPGHSPGHIGLWDPKHGAAYVADAVMGCGLLDRGGRVISPPPYFDVDAYLGTIQRLASLPVETLYTAHFLPMQGGQVPKFLESSFQFVQTVESTLESLLKAGGGPWSLSDLTQRVNERVGPFEVMENELAGPVLAHLKRWVKHGRAGIQFDDGRAVWYWI